MTGTPDVVRSAGLTVEQLRQVAASLADALRKEELLFESVGQLVDRVGEAVKACDVEVILVKGDLSGIQAYISTVNEAEDVDGGVMKRLRGRSFYLSAMCEGLAYSLAQRAGVAAALHVLHVGGGKFLVVLPRSAADAVRQWGDEVERWLWSETWGAVYLNLALVPCKAGTLLGPDFGGVARDLQSRLDENKRRKFDALFADGESFDTAHGRYAFPTFPIAAVPCHSCGRLPCGCRYNHPNDKEKLCRQCNYFEAEVGAYDGLPMHNYLDFQGEPGEQELSVTFYDVTAVLRDESVPGWPRVPGFVAQWPYRTGTWDGLSADPLPGTQEEEKRRRLCEHCAVYRTNPNECADRLPTRFHCLATLASQPGPSRPGGAARLAVLVADGDDFSLHFNATARVTLADHVVLGKLTTLFFGDYLVKLLKEHDGLLIYSGGDDLIVAGPWDGVIAAAAQLRKDFDTWTLGHLHFSAGVFIGGPSEPIYEAIAVAQQYRDEAKRQEGKNAVTVLGTTVPWPRFGAVFQLAQDLAAAERDGILTTSFLYGLYEIYRECEEYLLEDKVEGLRYLARLAAHIARNLRCNWPEGDQRTERAESLRKRLAQLHDVNDNDYLPYLRFALDWAALRGRGRGREEGI
jgi:CRISPR-associated protein Csm1